MNNSATKVFRRSLKIRRAASGLGDPASDAAWARKPSRGSGENTFCHPAVIVTVTSQASGARSEEHTSELQSQSNLVCRLLLEKKKHRDRQPYASYRSPWKA